MKCSFEMFCYTAVSYSSVPQMEEFVYKWVFYDLIKNIWHTSCLKRWDCQSSFVTHPACHKECILHVIWVWWVCHHTHTESDRSCHSGEVWWLGISNYQTEVTSMYTHTTSTQELQRRDFQRYYGYFLGGGAGIKYQGKIPGFLKILCCQR